MKFSPTERQTFLRCRRLWNYSSVNRMSLERKHAPVHFWLGEGIHYALAEFALGRDPVAAFSDWSSRKINEDIETYRSEVGVGMSNEELERLLAAAELGKAMLEHYKSYYKKAEPEGFEFIEPEMTLAVPVPGTPHELVVTVDGLLRKKETGDYYIIEHKTYQRQPSDAHIMRNQQMLEYIWAVQKFTGKRVVGAIYNGLLKKAPELPQLLKSGRLSVAQNQATTYELYLQAIETYGLNPYDYYDFLNVLKRRGNPFFHRVEVVRSQAELWDFEKHLPAQTMDMANPDLPIYPNFRWQGCYDCSFTELCDAERFNEDIDYVLRAKFQRRDARDGYLDDRLLADEDY